ncbi:hypothetical protein [Paenibacillus sp. IITD108]|uniref:hypothetical protein n=1 Tax=Paenibacillus sp. IITD108 TaxID=3116649 RepID=UPI002F410FB5
MRARIKSMNLMKKGILFVIVFIFIPAFIIFLAASSQASLAIKQQAGKALSELNRQNLATIDKAMDAIDQTVIILNILKVIILVNFLEILVREEALSFFLKGLSQSI